MDRFKHRYLDASTTLVTIDRVNHRRPNKGIYVGNVPGLRYSSPWPWVLALGISLSMWTGLVWLVRAIV